MELRENSKLVHPVTGHWRQADTVAASFLFAATAAVVVWQNLRLGVLWDISYILGNAHRMSLGDVPYRDFPFPYAPVTFLIQAAIIKLTGHVYFHHVIFSGVAGGIGTLLSWRIILNVVRGTTSHARLIAFLLTLPLVVLGVYCIYPHPFYDPDCTIVILIGVLLLQRLDRYGLAPLSAFACGVVLAVPLFVKQNTGLFFLASVAVGIVIVMAIDFRRGRRIMGYLWIAAGAVTTLVVALLLIHVFAGLRNYWHWTFQFAAERRAPDFHDMWEQFQNSWLPLCVALVAAGGILLAIVSRRSKDQFGEGETPRRSSWTNLAGVVSIVLMSAPFLWSVVYLFMDDDPSSRAEWLLVVWPVVLIIAMASALVRIASRSGFAAVIPFVLIGTIEGAFLSQQLWGSTYALWPLLMILIAILLGELAGLNRRISWAVVPLTAIVSTALIISGGFYVWSHERLDYANVWDGAITHSNLPSLKGLSMRGPWIPQFEELVRFSEREIPTDDGIVMIPGEDLFYYATGRHPRFPVIMFDHTVNPYSPEQVLALSTARNIRWLIVKRNLQMQGQPYEDELRTIQLLQRDFQPAARLENYDVYKRK